MDMTFLNNISNELQQIDYSLLAKIVSPIIIYYISDTTYKSYKLYKDSKVKKNTTIMLPPDIVKKYSEIDKEKIVKQKFSKEIIDFCSTISKNISNDNLGLFYNNANNLITTINNFNVQNLFFGEKTRACYLVEDNTLLVQKKRL